MGQFEDGLRIAARSIARAAMIETLLIGKASSNESSDYPARAHRGAVVTRSEGPLTNAVPKTAKMLGFSRNSAYEVIRTGQISSTGFGKRLFVPRVSLNRMISEADDQESSGRQHGRPTPVTIAHSQFIFRYISRRFFSVLRVSRVSTKEHS